MKKIFNRSFTLLTAIFIFNVSNAQLDLPRPSPNASVTQQVGLTDITIDYSCPGVKGRTIWGELVPYDKVWRAGANSATKITFSKPVSIEGTEVPKGSYSILMIPGENNWSIMINSDPTVSAGAYDSKKDVVKLSVKPLKVLTGPVVERLCYYFSDFDDASTTITMAWEKLSVSFKVMVDTDKQAVENIENATSRTWSLYNNAARYYQNKKDYANALKYVDISLSLADMWFNNWVKAQILFESGQKSEAYRFAEKAKELGDKDANFFFKSDVEKALSEWAAFAPKKKKK
ncbi:MAG: DUF2911 domain-containing protein [Flavobacteriales bacterium]|nr:DUF2911 domain-containing protein [Flavobacteriales bacterium]